MMDSEPIALVDGDPIVYSAAFSLQDYALVDAEHGQVIDIFSNRSEARQYADDIGLEDYVLDPYIEDYQACQDYIYSALFFFIEDICASTDAHHMKIFVTGPNSFRKELAPDYKANRKDFVRPLLYSQVKEMLVEKFGAYYAKDGFEADDALADEARMLFKNGLEESYVICTIDKDLDTVPGWHYRWAIYNKPSSYYWVTPEESRHHYWISVLTGDNADNIIGLKGIGPKKAEKIVAGCETDDQYERACEQAYFELYNGPYEADMQMEKNMQLLYLGTDRHGL